MGIKVVFLLDCSLVLFLLKYKGVGASLNPKNEDPRQEKPLK